MMQKLICLLVGHKRHIFRDEGEYRTTIPRPACHRCGKWLGDWWKREPENDTPRSDDDGSE